MENLLAALVAAVPATIAALGAWRSSAAGRRKVESIDRAVNGRPAHELTLVEKVDELRHEVGAVKADTDEVKRRLTTLERKVG